MNDQPEFDELPALSDETIARIENAVFSEIAEERAPVAIATTRARARRRRWLTGVGIAAAFAIGVVVTPPILGAVGGGSAMSTADGGSSVAAVPESVAGAPDRSADVAPDAASSDSAGLTMAGGEAADAGRDIIATANATLQVKDIGKAADAITALAEQHGGYVESTEVGKALALDDTSAPIPADSGYGWISIRVPSADLPDVIAELADSGEVLSSAISRQDLTSVAVDLRARVDATRASVERLTQLMAQSGSVSELIEAEVALTDRQAQLESYEQQLASIDDQVAMSSLSVQLTRTDTTVAADPAGFGDGLLAGWNGLVVSLNALVIAVGFILPWAGIAAVVVLVAWLIRRGIRARRASAKAPAAPRAD
ncbi:DUF4349 domain-containing protein [Microbacterium oxydans]|uniref:DUF4349 domain-containing protein n=1 Tax=Microbacterium oxydans TaxID=82380 RepID=A0A0F0L4N2_9MICO|nr:DUF4349 domain-containing protein [Microbacterium oxydans]KJL28118.1 hypothetical protein RS83_03183 [Microbacterium oxydans]